MFPAAALLLAVVDVAPLGWAEDEFDNIDEAADDTGLVAEVPVVAAVLAAAAVLVAAVVAAVDLVAGLVALLRTGIDDRPEVVDAAGEEAPVVAGAFPVVLAAVVAGAGVVGCVVVPGFAAGLAGALAGGFFGGGTVGSFSVWAKADRLSKMKAGIASRAQAALPETGRGRISIESLSSYFGCTWERSILRVVVYGVNRPECL